MDPTSWEVPDVSAWSGADFYWIRDPEGSACWTWDVLDMDGNGKPDLVWPEDPDGYHDPWDNDSAPSWRVYMAP
ncbi:MAG: hypothetical protein RBU30_17790 [Polyangia bacterium]|nr:hypothetical protein [Polyangia bacterium]